MLASTLVNFHAYVLLFLVRLTDRLILEIVAEKLFCCV